MSRVGGLYMKNRKDLEKLFRIKAVKNKEYLTEPWLDLYNHICDFNSDYIYYEERNGDDTTITNGLVSAYIAKEMGDLK
tara:strand:- start:795 stop:1031 length:237 start_codon:yes stop_codon:yes gene_type:complete